MIIGYNYIDLDSDADGVSATLLKPVLLTATMMDYLATIR
jgi:hypothetical protein